MRGYLAWRFGLTFYAPIWATKAIAVASPVALNWRRYGIPALAVIAVSACLLVEKATLPHYASPAAGAYALLCILTLRGIGNLSVLGVRAGRVARDFLITGWVVYVALAAVFPPPGVRLEEFVRARAEVENQLLSEPGRHLVLVDYGPSHNFHEEWIYNRADIDEARIVWARSLTERENAELVSYFASRKVWRLDADCKTPCRRLSRAEEWTR